MSSLVPKDSRVTIRTFAEGLFSRLAHDLELVCRKVSGTVEGNTAKLEVRIRDIEVHGTLKDGRVNSSGLSPSDREDCLEKMQRDVFHSNGDGVVRVEATADGDMAKVRVIPPRGKTVERTVRLRIGDDGKRVSGTFEISLSAIGSDVVKGPMNAFRVKDGVEIAFELTLQPA